MSFDTPTSKNNLPMLRKVIQHHKCLPYFQFLFALNVFLYFSISLKFAQSLTKKISFQVQEGLVQARQITSQTWDVISTKSAAIYGQGCSMISEGYSMLPPQIREFSDPALEATAKYSKIGQSLLYYLETSLPLISIFQDFFQRTQQFSKELIRLASSILYRPRVTK